MVSASGEIFVGSIPFHYDRELAPVIFAPYAEATAERIASLPAARVLETAAGTGVLTRALRDRLPEAAEIVATDLNAPMLEIARAKFSPGERVAFATVDAQTLPYPDAAFDALACQFGLMFFPDKARAQAEARRVLKPGGRYLFSVWDAVEANPHMLAVEDVLRAAFPDDPPRFFSIPHGFHALDPLRATLHGASFERIGFEVLPTLQPAPDRRLFAQGLLLGTPVSDQIRARGRDPAELVEALAAQLESRFGGAIPMRAILVTAIR